MPISEKGSLEKLVNPWEHWEPCCPACCLDIWLRSAAQSGRMPHAGLRAPPQRTARGGRCITGCRTAHRITCAQLSAPAPHAALCVPAGWWLCVLVVVHCRGRHFHILPQCLRCACCRTQGFATGILLEPNIMVLFMPIAHSSFLNYLTGIPVSCATVCRQVPSPPLTQHR